MHEISLVRQIFRSLEEQFTEKEIATIEKIKLKVGLLSNVEPILLQNAYEAVTATDKPAFKEASLEIEILPILIDCPSCGQRSQVENYRFVCPCGQPSSQVVQGTELLISGVVMENRSKTAMS